MYVFNSLPSRFVLFQRDSLRDDATDLLVRRKKRIFLFVPSYKKQSKSFISSNGITLLSSKRINFWSKMYHQTSSQSLFNIFAGALKLFLGSYNQLSNYSSFTTNKKNYELKRLYHFDTFQFLFIRPNKLLKWHNSPDCLKLRTQSLLGIIRYH